MTDKTPQGPESGPRTRERGREITGGDERARAGAEEAAPGFGPRTRERGREITGGDERARAGAEEAANICILDYGVGNLRSVEKALEHIGAAATISREPGEVRAADGVILPGVGAFPKAMERIRDLGLDQLVAERRDAGIPILGICLGLQLLFDSTSELGGADGLGFLPGRVERLNAPGLKVPHIGWAAVRWEKESALTEGIDSGTPFYLVHSFAPEPAPGHLLGTAEYGERFACAAENGNVYGVQFHPEKSGAAGLRLLANFAGICARTPTAA